MNLKRCHQIPSKEIENREKDKEPKLTALPKWLSSKNDFNEAMKDIRTDTNYVKSDSANKKFLMIWMI